jgi:hypothetical protein
MDKHERLISAAILAVGILLAGWLIGRGLMAWRTADRYVTVKGFSEREVKADMALWPIRFVSTNDNLGRAQGDIKKSKDIILSFLEKHGMDPKTVEIHKFEVTDILANPYRSPGTIQSRYIISQTLMVRSKDPSRVMAASQAIGDLVDAGVILSANPGMESTPSYLFTGLNALKPEMIAEATANARQAAEQFAKDSGSRVGGIRKASQGVFEILPRDRTPGVMEWTQPNKTLRVVTTIEYYLEG